MVTSIITNWKLNPKERKPLTIEDTGKKDHNVLCAIQAWTKSTRYPGKIYAQLAGAPLLFHTINRIGLVSNISTTVVASPEDLAVPDGIEVFIHRKAMDKDVLSLYYNAMVRYKPDYVVRITSDCPVLDPFLVEFILHQAIKYKADYCSNVMYPLSFPDGQDVEIISTNLLEFLNNTVKSKDGREHVTLEFRKRPLWHQSFNTIDIRNCTNYSHVKLSIDTPADLKRLEAMEMV